MVPFTLSTYKVAKATSASPSLLERITLRIRGSSFCLLRIEAKGGANASTSSSVNASSFPSSVSLKSISEIINQNTREAKNRLP